jgi:mono/diheme cytochrome c family protein
MQSIGSLGYSANFVPPMNSQPPVEKPDTRLAGILAEFDSPESLKAAARRLRDEGFTRWDSHSPFPLHGIDRAMGVRTTRLPWIVLAGGIVGVSGALLMQWWMNAINYPMVISGKPYFSLPANVPIMFELLVLVSAFAAFGGALVLNLLPQFGHWTLSSRKFARVTTDGFFISVDAADPKFDPAAIHTLLNSLGATNVEDCYESAEGQTIPSALYWTLAVVGLLAVLPPLFIAKYRAETKSLPRIHPIQDMSFQEKYQPQATSSLFSNGMAMRKPVPGAVSQENLDENDHLYRGLVDGQPAKTFPVPVSMSMMLRGQNRFNIFCATCHGLLGDGGNTSMVSIRAIKREEPKWVLPLSLHKPEIRQQPVGQYFATITNGVRTMPSYAAQIPVEDRWAIVLYIRALQLSQNATIKDVPEDLRDQLR